MYLIFILNHCEFGIINFFDRRSCVSTTARNRYRQYFITFIDDYSRYGYIYLIHEKSKSLDTFKIFKAMVENQLNKRIKSVRSDRGGEFYGRSEQCLESFAQYLKQSSIAPQYTMPDVLV